MGREAALQSVNPASGRLQIQGGNGQLAQLRFPQSMPVQQEHHQMVSPTMASCLGGT